MRIRGPLTTLIGLLAVLAAGCGGGGGGGEVSIDEPFSFVPAVDTTAAYFEITNEGDTDDVLVSASAEGFESVQVHDTVTEDGSAQMVEQTDGVPIPAGETVTLEPGGLHVMLIGSDHEIAAGDEITITLTFEEAGEVEITSEVREREAGDAPAMDMGGSEGEMDMGATEGG
ncbi:copper chaperone PCu(A)C [Euzebya sp.]|uniref:copper chaperone PCu(A)C n=1 Tax=Euzebya sp. TaxID=1971409 RepID=UPI003511AD1F